MGVYTRACVSSVLHAVDIFIRLYLFSHVYQVSSVSFGKGNVLLFYFMYLLSPVMLPCLFVSVSNFTNTTNTYIFSNFYWCNTFRYYFCFYFAVMFGFLPRDWSAGCFLWMYVNSSFVLNYINVYHEDACDGNLYLVFFLWLFFLRLGYVVRLENKKIHMIY